MTYKITIDGETADHYFNDGYFDPDQIVVSYAMLYDIERRGIKLIKA